MFQAHDVLFAELVGYSSGRLKPLRVSHYITVRFICLSILFKLVCYGIFIHRKQLF